MMNNAQSERDRKRSEYRRKNRLATNILFIMVMLMLTLYVIGAVESNNLKNTLIRKQQEILDEQQSIIIEQQNIIESHR